VIGALALAASLAVASGPGAPARVSLAASPSHVSLAAGGRQAIRVTSTGGGSLRVAASVAGFALDLRGRPRIAGPGDAAPWLTVTPRTFAVAGGAGAALVVASRRPAGARPGDHSAVILLSAVVPSARGVVVRMRVGLVVSVRVPGRIVHRVVVAGARVRHAHGVRLLELTLANRGNVIESIGARRIRVTIVRDGRAVARYLAGHRELLPRTSGVIRIRARLRVRGRVLVRVALSRTGGPWVERRFRLRL
jgi:hypothetical protein